MEPTFTAVLAAVFPHLEPKVPSSSFLKTFDGQESYYILCGDFERSLPVLPDVEVTHLSIFSNRIAFALSSTIFVSVTPGDRTFFISIQRDGCPQETFPLEKASFTPWLSLFAYSCRLKD